MNFIKGKFEKYPDVQIISDPINQTYKVKYVECVEERGAIRFEKREKIVSKDLLESSVGEIIFMVEKYCN